MAAKQTFGSRLKSFFSRADRLLAAAAAIVTIIIAIPLLVPDCQPDDDAPQFTVSAINTLKGEEGNVYEITNHFIGAEPTDMVRVEWGLKVKPDYNGDIDLGEVRVLVKNARGDIVVQDRWEHFDSESPTLEIPLDPYELCRDVGRVYGFTDNIFETGVFTVPEVVYDIEIVDPAQPDAPLHTDHLTIRNAPWYHYTALTYYDGRLNVFVCGKNAGGESHFFVISEVFEITQIPREAWTDWRHVASQQREIDVAADDDFTLTLEFPEADSASPFEPGKEYFVNVYLVKQQNYANVLDTEWQYSAEKWRFGSYGITYIIET
jgi:hypothetical protein